jgi:hypothetical protein
MNKRQNNKAHPVMHEFKQDTLESGNTSVENRKQAVTIALNKVGASQMQISLVLKSIFPPNEYMVTDKFKQSALESGSSNSVENRKQAVTIALNKVGASQMQISLVLKSIFSPNVCGYACV